MKRVICVALALAGASSLSAQDFDVEFGNGADAFSEHDRALVTSIATAAYHEVQELLPSFGEAVTLTVSAGGEVIPETGEVGAALAPGHVLWVVDPSRPGGVSTIAREHLRATLFHEFHHLARGYVMTGSESPITLIDSVVSEGLATAFARDYASYDAPWGHYPDNVAAWVQELLALPPGTSYQEWMFDHPDGRRWIGCRAGTFVADHAIQASGHSAAGLVATSTEDILDLAGIR